MPDIRPYTRNAYELSTHKQAPHLEFLVFHVSPSFSSFFFSPFFLPSFKLLFMETSPFAQTAAGVQLVLSVLVSPQGPYVVNGW